MALIDAFHGRSEDERDLDQGEDIGRSASGGDKLDLFYA
jgi:hypothetical protein